MTNTVTIKYPGEFTAIFPMVSDSTYQTDLERIFAEWNAGSGCESELFVRSQVRSLSVNDFVSINGHWWQCASLGWRPITKEFVDKVEAAVLEHPDFHQSGWFALHEVMRQFNFGLRADWQDEPVTA